MFLAALGGVVEKATALTVFRYVNVPVLTYPRDTARAFIVL